MNLDDINANEPVTMTADLVRLFRAAGCSPTACHACGKKLLVGHVFKLVPHTKPGQAASDEMCCDKCDSRKLDARDQRNATERRSPVVRGNWGGYSRPSKTATPQEPKP